MIEKTLFLIYQELKKIYDVELEDRTLTIKKSNIALILFDNKILAIYRKGSGGPADCLLDLDTLKVIPCGPPLNKKESSECVVLGYLIKEILKPNSVKFIESL